MLFFKRHGRHRRSQVRRVRDGYGDESQRLSGDDVDGARGWRGSPGQVTGGRSVRSQQGRTARGVRVLALR